MEPTMTGADTTDEPFAGEPSRRKITTLDMLSPSQIAAIRSIPPIDEMELPSDTATRPVSYFLSEDVFAAEMANVFRRVPLPIVPSALLAEHGTTVAHDHYGLPLLISRDNDGAVRVFLNACKHKGAKLLEDHLLHRTPRLTCPYHSWTYGLNGALIGIAQPECFTGIVKADYGLTELPSREFGGLIWAVLNREREPDFSDLVPAFADDLEHLGIPYAHLYGRKSFEVRANWKLVLEPFQENYHVRRLHKNSIGLMFKDTTSVIDKLGPHQRKLKPRGEFTREMLNVPGVNIHKAVNHVYQIFPNGVLITSPYYVSLMTVIPVAIDHTIVEYFMLVPEAPTTVKAKEVMTRSFELVLKVFGTEDFRAAEISHAGLKSGALEHVVYGGMEMTIPRYYDQLDRYVASGAVANEGTSVDLRAVT